MGNIHMMLYEILTSGSESFSYLELWQSLCSVDWNHLCNLGRRHHEEQCFEIILNLDQWFSRKCSLKVFLIRSSGSPFFQWSITIVQFW